MFHRLYIALVKRWKYIFFVHLNDFRGIALAYAVFFGFLCDIHIKNVFIVIFIALSVNRF